MTNSTSVLNSVNRIFHGSHKLPCFLTFLYPVPAPKIVRFYWLQLRITCKSSWVNANTEKLLCRKVEYKSIEEEGGVSDFDWIIGLLRFFVLKLRVKSWIAAQNVIFSLHLTCHRTNEFTVVEPIDGEPSTLWFIIQLTYRKKSRLVAKYCL